MSNENGSSNRIFWEHPQSSTTLNQEKINQSDIPKLSSLMSHKKRKRLRVEHHLNLKKKSFKPKEKKRKVDYVMDHRIIYS